MATRHAVLTDLDIQELRYLRKAIRYRLGKRNTKPQGRTDWSLSHIAALDAIADWILQDAC